MGRQESQHSMEHSKAKFTVLGRRQGAQKEIWLLAVGFPGLYVASPMKSLAHQA